MEAAAAKLLFGEEGGQARASTATRVCSGVSSIGGLSAMGLGVGFWMAGSTGVGVPLLLIGICIKACGIPADIELIKHRCCRKKNTGVQVKEDYGSYDPRKPAPGP